MAQNRADMELRRKIWESHVLDRLSHAEICRKWGISEDQLEAHMPHIEAFIKRDAELTRATIREAQVKDLLDSLAECRKLLKKAKLPPALKLSTMDRQAKLWDRLSRAEGTDRHREKVEISGPGGSNLQIDHQLRAGIVDMYKARKQLDQQEKQIQEKAGGLSPRRTIEAERRP